MCVGRKGYGVPAVVEVVFHGLDLGGWNTTSKTARKLFTPYPFLLLISFCVLTSTKLKLPSSSCQAPQANFPCRLPMCRSYMQKAARAYCSVLGSLPVLHKSLKLIRTIKNTKSHSTAALFLSKISHAIIATPFPNEGRQGIACACSEPDSAVLCYTVYSPASASLFCCSYPLICLPTPSF